MRKFKTIIFDCDGVLVDSEIIANRVDVEMKTQHGISITLEEQLQKFVGLSDQDPVMLEEMGRLPSDYRKKLHTLIRQTYHTELKAIDGVRETLEKIQVPKCVVSNSDTESLLFKLRLTNIIKYFPNCAFSVEDVRRAKPAPDLYFHALATMKWRSEDCLVVEDSVAGVQGAKAAGLFVCGFIGGGHMYPGHSDKLLNCGVDKLITDFREILNLLD